MGVVLSFLPKTIVLQDAGAASLPMNNFSGSEAPVKEVKCDCGCGKNAGCCEPPKRLNLAQRRRVRLRNAAFRNFSLVEFLYTPNTSADFEPFFRNCCGA